MGVTPRGAIEGTFYKNISYMLGAEYQWDGGSKASLITFGSPVERGQQGSSVNEAVNLVHYNTYNPNWGYQDGKKRNARVVKSWDPTAILSYMKMAPKAIGLRAWKAYTTTVTVAPHSIGTTEPTHAPITTATLPSYFKGTPGTRILTEYLWRSGEISQINWDRLYQANHTNNRTGDGAAIYIWWRGRRSDLFETLPSTPPLTSLQPSKALGWCGLQVLPL